MILLIVLRLDNMSLYEYIINVTILNFVYSCIFLDIYHICDNGYTTTTSMLNLKSVCKVIEEGDGLTTYMHNKPGGKLLPPYVYAVKAMHVELTVLLVKHGVPYIRYNHGTTNKLQLERSFFLGSPFAHLKESDQLDVYMDKLFQFFHNVQSLLSSNDLPPGLKLNCCSNGTCSKGFELNRNSIINSFVFQMLRLNRCDIIKLILQQHGEVFSVAMLNRYLQIAGILYRCKECFQELQSHGADINYLRNQPDLFDNFFRFYRSTSDKHDHAILSALYDSDVVVRSKSHFHDLCYVGINAKTKHLLIQQMCVRCEHEENHLKLQAQYNMPIAFVPSDVFCYLWRDVEWDLIGIYYYAG